MAENSPISTETLLSRAVLFIFYPLSALESTCGKVVVVVLLLLHLVEPLPKNGPTARG